MPTSCSQCGASFSITEEDSVFLEKVSPVFNGKKHVIPSPTRCPDCRQQRRAAWRNEWTLYKRGCDLCKKQVVSIYPSDSPFPVYCNQCWWSDKWDPLSFGKSFDPSQSFFVQWKELRDVVPRNALYLKNADNSDFCNHCDGVKNCYLSVSVGSGENVYYSEWIISCRDLCDCYQMEKTELCYESIYSVGDYNCTFVYLSDNCRDSAFLFDCKDCNHCFLCWNLQRKEYCIENVQYTKDEYEKRMAAINTRSWKQMHAARERFLTLVRSQAIHKCQHVIYSEDSSGDMVYKCKNVKDSYDVIESQDCRYCYYAGHQKDSFDVYESAFNCELQYDTHACNRGTRTLFSTVSYDVDSVYYVDSCHNSSQLFGCVGLKRAKNCILNKQYTPEEYERKASEIAEAMQKQGTWGEFFPMDLSPFSYNETMAMHFSPLKREEASAKGVRWKDDIDAPHDAKKAINAKDLPDLTDQIPDGVLQWAVKCDISQRPFRIIAQELDFYRRMQVPVPHLHPDERWKRRQLLRNPRHLWQRQCTNCKKEIESTYAPDRHERVYCFECYNKAIYG